MEELIRKLKLEVSTLKAQLLELGIAPRVPGRGAKLADEPSQAASPLD